MKNDVRGAEVVLPCADLSAALEVFERVGFRVETILPADDPSIAVICGHGLRLRLVRGTEPPGASIRIVTRDPAAYGTHLAGGIAIELVAEEEEQLLAPLRPAFVVTRNDERAWRVGRAGMHYRDLIPDRQGGRFVASHIRIPEGGPVADYVHFHAIRFQLIFCRRGWVRLVYEDQGEPFVMNAGEVLLQPPKIRHRVLEASPGLEVIEIASPAVHATHADHELALPTGALRAERSFDGQRFGLDRAPHTRGYSKPPGVDPSRSIDIGAASAGIVGARVRHSGETVESLHNAELMFGFVLDGGMTVSCEGVREVLSAGDAFVIPAARSFSLADGTAELAWLEVTAPASVDAAPLKG